MDHPYTDPGLYGPASPYDLPDPCPECGAADAEYGQHEPGCPSGYPTRELTPAERERDELQNAYRDAEEEANAYGGVWIPGDTAAEPWTDADTAELAQAMSDAAWRIADRHSEARAGADRSRRVAADPDWSDCDRWNGPDTPTEREYAGQYRERTYRLARDVAEHSPYRPDDRPWPILAIARHALYERDTLAAVNARAVAVDQLIRNHDERHGYGCGCLDALDA